MKRSALLPTLGAVTLVALALFALFGGGARTPMQLIGEVQEMMRLDDYDGRIALRLLDRAQAGAVQRGDELTELKAVSLRAAVLEELGSFHEARAALERLLEAMPDNPKLELRVARLMANQGDVEPALEKVRALLARDPAHSEAWMLGGGLQLARASAAEAEALSIARGALVREEFDRLTPTIRELCARDPGDPERPGVAARVARTVRPKDELAYERLAESCDRAAADTRSARSCFARSFDGLASVEAARGLIEGWTLAGKPALASELGLIATRVPAIGENADVAAPMLEALEASGKEQDLRAFLTNWNWDLGGGDASFYLDASVTLLRLDEPRYLMRAADLLQKYGGEAEAEYAVFFQGMALCSMDRHEDGINRLRKYTRSKTEEPFPGAMAKAWARLAASYRELNAPRGERESLEGLAAFPDLISGEELLRLVELQREAQYSGARVPEERWTAAMAKLPGRTDELMAEWSRLGELSAREEGRDLDEIMSRLAAQQRSLPAADVGPYLTYRVARSHLDRHAATHAFKAAEALLATYPTLLPALDIAIRAQLDRGRRYDAANLILERLELVGRDATSVSFLEELGTERLGGAQILQAMSADPGGTGRLAVARYLIESGEAERALRAVDAPEGRATAEEAIVAGQALLELGRPDEAAERVRRLIGDRVFGPSALTVEYEARLAVGESEGLEALVRRTLALETIHRPVWMAAIDGLLQSRHPDLARPLLERLDEAPETRGGDLFLRQALLGALTDNRGATLEGLSRAEAYLEDGSAELGRLLLAVDDHAWTQLPERVADLRAAGFVASPLEEAVLTLFDEKLEAAATLAAARLENGSTRPEWALVLAASQLLSNVAVELPASYGSRAAPEATRLLRGDGDSLRDPRLVLGLLVGLERPGWSKWAIPRLVALRDEGAGALWPNFLGARAYEALGQRDEATRMLSALVGRAPDFRPGWDAWIELATETWGDPWHPRVVRLRAQRLEMLGEEAYADPLEAAVDRAALRALEGDDFLAVQGLEEALAAAAEAAAAAEEPAPVFGRALLARILRDRGDLEGAAREYLRACGVRPPRSDDPLVAEFVQVLNTMTRRSLLAPPVPPDGEPNADGGLLGDGPLGEERVAPADADVPAPFEQARVALARLSEHFPRDPLVALASARLKLVTSGGRGTAITSALRVLADFRRRTDVQPLDTLRPGSSEAWIGYLLPRAPETAQLFVEQDLANSPGNVDLWFLSARCADARGMRQQAARSYERLTAMSRDPRAFAGLAFVLAKQGASLETVEAELLAAEDNGLAPDDPRGTLIRQIAELAAPRPKTSRVLRELEELWRDRTEHAEWLEPQEIGRVYVRALALSGQEADFRQLARLCIELRNETDDPYAHDYFRALGGLASLLEKEARASARERARDRARREATGEAGASETPKGEAAPADGDR